MNKVYVFADIHGCSHELAVLLEQVRPDEESDTLVFLGDYINRGPNSKKVVDILIDLKRRFRHLITLIGNHEQIILHYLRGEKKDFFLRMGGEATLKSYGLSEPWPESLAGLLPESHELFFNDLVSYWEDETHIFVHAGLQPGVHVSQQSSDWLFWARDEFVNLKHKFPKKIIYGHTPFKDPKVDPNKIGIDTGAVYGGYLTCLVVPGEIFFRSKG